MTVQGYRVRALTSVQGNKATKCSGKVRLEHAQ